MIHIYATFDTEAEAIAYRDRYYASYHPMGYGTHIKVWPPKRGRFDPNQSDKWVAIGSRAASCD